MCFFYVIHFVCGHHAIRLDQSSCHQLTTNVATGETYCGRTPNPTIDTLVEADILERHHTPEFCSFDCAHNTILQARGQLRSMIRIFEETGCRYHESRMLTREAPEIDEHDHASVAQVFGGEPGPEANASPDIYAAVHDVGEQLVYVEIVNDERDAPAAARAFQLAIAMITPWRARLREWQRIVDEMYNVQDSWGPRAYQLVLHETQRESMLRWMIATRWVRSLPDLTTGQEDTEELERVVAEFFGHFWGEEPDEDAFVGWIVFWRNTRPRANHTATEIEEARADEVEANDPESLF